MYSYNTRMRNSNGKDLSDQVNEENVPHTLQ